MKSFKQYLNEARGTSLSDLLFLPRIGYYDQLMIPISSPMFKRIWPDTLRATVFHTTDGDGIKSISKLEGKKKINSSLSYKEKNYLGEIKKGMVRIVTWEILQNTNAYINEFPETLKEIDLKIDGNNYGCLNSLGDNLLIMLHNLQAFTNFSFNSGKKNLELTMESESSGKIKQKKKQNYDPIPKDPISNQKVDKKPQKFTQKHDPIPRVVTSNQKVGK